MAADSAADCGGCVVFMLLRPLRAHLMIEGSTLDVVIHRDRITVRAEVTSDEVRMIQSLSGEMVEDLDPKPEFARYGQYLLSHLHYPSAERWLTGWRPASRSRV